MLIEVAVFRCHQRIDQQIREPGAWHEQALLAVRRLQHGNQPRIETEETKVAVAVEVFNLAELAVTEAQTRTNLPFFAVGKIKRSTDHLNAVGLYGEFTRPRHPRNFAILRAFQQRNHLFFVVGHARLKANHAAINGGRQLPHLAINTAADL